MSKDKNYRKITAARTNFIRDNKNNKSILDIKFINHHESQFFLSGFRGQKSTRQQSTNKSQPPKVELNFIEKLFCGGAAGVTEILIMYPLDVVKTRAQIAVGKTGGLLSTLSSMVRTEGIRMYRGILPPIIMEAPKRAIKFAANSTYQPWFRDVNGRLSTAGATGAGTLAGVSEAFFVVPFELVKIRLQDKANAGLYSGTGDAVVKIIKNEGVLALYKGLESTIWRHATWNAGYFGLINQVKLWLPKPTNQRDTTLTDFTAGALAGTFGTMLNTPFDVVKSRIQNQDARLKPGEIPKYSWTLPGLKMIFAEEGASALYKGFVPKVLRLGPGGGILLVVYEFLSQKILASKRAKAEAAATGK